MVIFICTFHPEVSVEFIRVWRSLALGVVSMNLTELNCLCCQLLHSKLRSFLQHAKKRRKILFLPMAITLTWIQNLAFLSQWFVCVQITFWTLNRFVLLYIQNPGYAGRKELRKYATTAINHVNNFNYFVCALTLCYVLELCVLVSSPQSFALPEFRTIFTIFFYIF